ncbi:hypothetical protein EVAR_100198_1 [Eumeta japonica]|uniref:Uncharacterized protein n=1 Tax=Eumeta variegata TaxID=151549 RepID=A0A4C1T2J5_EUMVA|nr:hypothetical protein EVAR_100198_1 [Eumeta japonica]
MSWEVIIRVNRQVKLNEKTSISTCRICKRVKLPRGIGPATELRSSDRAPSVQETRSRWPVLTDCKGRRRPQVSIRTAAVNWLLNEKCVRIIVQMQKTPPALNCLRMMQCTNTTPPPFLARVYIIIATLSWLPHSGRVSGVVLQVKRW